MSRSGYCHLSRKYMTELMKLFTSLHMEDIIYHSATRLYGHILCSTYTLLMYTLWLTWVCIMLDCQVYLSCASHACVHYTLIEELTSIHIAIIYFCVNSPPSSHIYFSILRVNFHVCAFELEKKKNKTVITLFLPTVFSLFTFYTEKVCKN